jgi:hypothetical protein
MQRFMITITPLTEEGTSTEMLCTSRAVANIDIMHADDVLREVRRYLQDGLDELKRELDKDDTVTRLLKGKPEEVAPEPEPVPDNGKRVYVERIDFIPPTTLLNDSHYQRELLTRATHDSLMASVELDGGDQRSYYVKWLPLARLSIAERFLVVAIRKPLTFEDVHQEVADIIKGAGSNAEA